MFRAPAIETDDDADYQQHVHPTASGSACGVSTTGESDVLDESPGSHTNLATASPRMTLTPETAGPPSPPPLDLQQTERDAVRQGRTRPSNRGGWEAELWRLYGKDDSSPSMTNTCKRIASFKGGGADEDILCLGPGGSTTDSSDIIAVDLSIRPATKNVNASTKESNGRELLLCCLTKAGQMKVYGIPEADELVSTRSLPPSNALSEGMNARREALNESIISQSTSARVYKRTDEQPSWWNQTEEDVFGDNAKGVQDEPSPVPITHRVGRGATSQFMEPNNNISAPATPGAMPGGEVASITSPSTNNGEGDAGVSGDAQNAPIDMSKAARVPCPPLCGAAFSAGGVGGLVTFHNGQVKRMWTWYQSNEIAIPEAEHKTNCSSPLTSQAMKAAETISGVPGLSDDLDEDEKVTNSKDDGASGEGKFPRTMFHLIEMSSKAKIAQWGEDANVNNESSDDAGSASSDDTTSYGDTVQSVLDSDASDYGTSGSDDSDGFHLVSRQTSSASGSFDNMFDAYFSSSRKPLTRAETDLSTQKSYEEARSSAIDDSSSIDQFAGLTSLSPNVMITSNHDEVVLNGQTPELAQLLQLGDCWWLNNDDSFSVPNSSWTNGERAANSWERWDDNSVFQRNSSDPNLSYAIPERRIERSSSFSSQPVESKQTTMMGNLKKLFSYQSPTVAMTPPDQNLSKY